MSSERNKKLREQIEALEKQREGMSQGNIDYSRITEDIKALALQLEPEHHWSTVPLFWVSVVAMVAACIAAIPVVHSFLQDQPSPQGPEPAHESFTSRVQSMPASHPSPTNSNR